MGSKEYGFASRFELGEKIYQPALRRAVEVVHRLIEIPDLRIHGQERAYGDLFLFAVVEVVGSALSKMPYT